jgi:hypothetical protein
VLQFLHAQTALPPRTRSATTEAGVLARPLAGLDSCGTAPGFNRTSLIPVVPGRVPGRLQYRAEADQA